MKGVRHLCQHIFNPLHIYCRLRQLGMSGAVARSVSRAYEHGVYRFLMWQRA